ncbi:tetratricopeptide repeat protein [Streptomyces sp. DSM 44917]|uniref:Tetratricopeptide repeat protein n=1 Tax=Streptomyces boetiae TaxID=3075541 RepID=A0ABU2L6V4_9ACTN|nr:tetratricopeptide repeat protein [Streptomyces sp. DSM 44917]MDT0307300.1 tetratricopeptide repeat protein [Streptomyces sp. DSM 44917]
MNSISGSGVFIGPVIQGRDITVQLPPQITPALGGLPGASPAFTGREKDIEEVKKVLAPGGSDAGGPRTVLVSAVSGLAGVGKTELAVKVGNLAWKVWGWFPGGVLFTELHGYDAERLVPPEQALEGLLRALAVPGDHLPRTLQDRQRLYHSILAAYAEQGQRVLVLVDDASSADQVRPLLPADGVNAALVTSRHTLAINARLHDLDVLDERNAVEMLREELRMLRGDGDTRVRDEPEAAAKIAQLCACLPLALNIAAALLADDHTQQRTAADLATALEAEHTRLRRLRRDELAVRAAFDLSYARLDQQQARLFRLLPLNPGPDLSTEAAARLAAVEELGAEEILESLARAHLVERRHGRRWGMHDLVRLYAYACGREPSQAAADQRETARARLFTHYQDTAADAATHLELWPGPRSSGFHDRSRALQWLDAELANLIATATAAPRLGHPATTIALAFGLTGYLDHRRYFDDWITLTTTALAICRELGDRHREGGALSNLGLALAEVRRFEEAIETLTRAVGIFRELDDHHREGGALSNLGLALAEVRRFEEAIEAHTRDLAICRELGDRHGEGQALNNLALALAEARRCEEAIEAHTRAVGIFRELDDHHREGQALSDLGLVLAEVRRFEEAIEAHTRAVGIFRELDDHHREGQALNNLALALAKAGRRGDAVAVVEQAVKIYRGLAANTESGREPELVRTLLRSAWLKVDVENGRVLPGALAAAEEAVERLDQLTETRPAAFSGLLRDGLGLLAAILEGLGRAEEAEQVHRRIADFPPRGTSPSH